MASKGTITGKELISDEGLQRPLELEKHLKKVLETTEELSKVALQYNKLLTKSKITNSEKEYIALKRQEILLDKDAIRLQNELNKAKLSAQRVETERERTRKIKLEADRKQNAAIEQGTKLTIKERIKVQEENKALKLQARQQLGLVDAYERLNTKRNEAQRTLANLLSVEKKNQKEIDKAQRNYAKLDKRVKEVDASTKNFSKNVGNYKSAIGGLTGTIKALISALGVVGGLYAFVDVMKKGITIVRDFGATMSSVAGIYRVSRKDLAELESQIISVAGSSVKTANEVALLAESLATLGKTKEEIADLLEPVNDLSIGLKASSEDTAEFLIQTINAFGGSSKEAKKYADTIATIRTSTSLDFEKMKDSFQYLTPISRILNKDLAYTGSLIGLLADNGIKAERAGRLLGTAQQKLAKEGKTLVDALDEVNTASANGVKEIDLLAIASNLFGKQAASLGIILASNSEQVDINAEAIRNNGGALDDLVNEQLQSLDAHFKILNSRWEEYILNTDKSTGSSNVLKKALKFLSDNLGKLISGVILATKIWIGYKAVVYLARVQQSLMNKQLFLSRKASLASAKGISKASLAWGRFNKVLKANALGLAIIGITVLVSLMNKAKASTTDLARSMNEGNKEFEKQAKTSTEVNTKLSAMTKRYKELTKDGVIPNKEEQIELDTIIKSLAKNVPGAVTEFDKYGRALIVNTGLVDDFKKSNGDLYLQQAETKIKNQTKLLSELEVEQTRVNKGLSNGNAFNVTNIGLIRKTEKGLINVIAAKKQVSKTDKLINIDQQDSIELSEKQQALLTKSIEDRNKQINGLKETIEVNKDIIGSITGNLTARQKLAKTNEENAKKAEEKAEKQAKIDAKEKKAQEERLKYREEDAKKIQLLKKDAYELTKFFIEKEIELQSSIINSENTSFEERKKALEKHSDAEIRLAELSKNRLLDNTKLTTDGKALIERKHQAELLDIQRKGKSDKEKLIESERKKSREDEYATELNKIKALEKKDLSILLDSLKNKKLTVEEYEKQVRDTKIKYAKESLDYQLKVIQALIDAGGLSTEKQIENEKKLAAIKKGISDIQVDTTISNSVKIEEQEANTNEKLKELGQDLAHSLTDIVNSSFNNRIQNLDNDIQKNEQYYNDKIALAEGDEAQQELLRQESEKKRLELEKKKKKAQNEQAKFNRDTAAFNVAMRTTQAVLGALADVPKVDFGISAGLLAAAYAGIGAAELTSIYAHPLPKYAKGTDNHKGGFALVGEERAEVITEPGKDPYIVSGPSVLDLPKGTIVTPSLEEYEEMFRQSSKNSIYRDHERVTAFQIQQQKQHSSRINEEAIRNAISKGFKDQKVNFHTTAPKVKIDLGHETWKNNNVNW